MNKIDGANKTVLRLGICLQGEMLHAIRQRGEHKEEEEHDIGNERDGAGHK